MNGKMKIFAGSSNRPLASRICDSLSIKLGNILTKGFSDGETRVEIEESVRGDDVYIIQSTCPPVNQNVMELLVMIDAFKRASARRITAVIPYYGYARQDRKVAPRAPITAKLIADLLTAAGAHRVLTMDLHAGQIQGFFNIPVDNLFAQPVFMEYFDSISKVDKVIVSPDAGGVERARSYAKKFDVKLAIIDKRREGPNENQVMNVIGEVKDKTAFVIDDMIDTAGTLVKGAEALKANGAFSIVAICTHPVLSGQAINRIISSPDIRHVIITDTIPLSPEASASHKFVVMSTNKLFATAINCINKNDSVSSLFKI